MAAPKRTRTPKPASEARRWPRYAASIPVSVSTLLDGERLLLRGGASDISRGGMRLFLTRELKSGTSLILEFLIPYNAVKLALGGVIRNRNGFTHGVEFVNATLDQQEMIERTCKVLELLD